MQVSKSGNHIKLFFRFHEAACYMRTCKLKVVITRQRRALHTYTPGISQKVKRRCSAHAFFVSKKKKLSINIHMLWLGYMSSVGL